MVLLKLLGICILVRIAIEDLRAREVALWLFVALGAVVGCLGLKGVGAAQWFWSSSVNLLVVMLMLAGALGYMWLRSGGTAGILQGTIGAGDIVLLGLMAIGFTTHGFVLFVVASLLFAVAGHFIVRWILKMREPTVAMAGWLAICWSLVWLDHLSISVTDGMFSAY